jgi:hypothetical protein
VPRFLAFLVQNITQLEKKSEAAEGESAVLAVVLGLLVQEYKYWYLIC